MVTVQNFIDRPSQTCQCHDDAPYSNEDKQIKAQFPHYKPELPFSLNCFLPESGFFLGLTKGHSELRQQSQGKLQWSVIQNILIIHYLIQSTHTFILIYFQKCIKHSFILLL